jgi:hypothetical protein
MDVLVLGLGLARTTIYSSGAKISLLLKASPSLRAVALFKYNRKGQLQGPAQGGSRMKNKGKQNKKIISVKARKLTKEELESAVGGTTKKNPFTDTQQWTANQPYRTMD